MAYRTSPAAPVTGSSTTVTAASGSSRSRSSPPPTKSWTSLPKMALHQAIQRLLLVGVRLQTLPVPPTPRPPERLVPLIAAIAPAHDTFDERAIYFGHRYRSGYWAIYMLSAVAVLFAVLPLALGWDDARHVLHPYVGLWEVGEGGVIGTVGAI